VRAAAVSLFAQLAATSAQATDEPAAEESGLPVAAVIAIVLVVVVFAVVLGPRVIRVIDRRTLSWPDGWLKSVVIVVYFIVFTVFLPSFVLQMSTVAALSRPAQELVGSAVWAVGLGAGLVGLWYAQRTSRI